MRITLPSEEPVEKKAPIENLAEDMLEVSELSFTEKRKYRKEQERKKKADMTKAERRQYFLDYYKWPTIVGIIVVIAVIILGINIYQNSIPSDLCIAVFNTEKDIINYDELKNDYKTYLGSSERNGFTVHYNYKISFENWNASLKEASSSDSTAYEQIVAYSKSNYYDAIITDKAGYEYSLGTDLVYNLKNVMTDEELDKYSKYVLYETLADGSVVPIGLNISSGKNLDKLQLSYDEIYLVFPCMSDTNIKHISELLIYILG